MMVTMTRGIPALVVLLIAGCGRPAATPSPSPAGLAQDAAADTALLGEVQAAVNEVIRSVPDCDAIKARMQEAVRKIDEASDRVRTESARVTLKTLRAQLSGPAELCP